MTLRQHRITQYVAIALILSLGAGWYYQTQTKGAQTTVDNRPSFEAPLTHTIDLTAGQGSATFTRADGADRRATVTDFEGRIIPVKQNEARFEGARRVENLLTYSEAFDNAVWTKQGLGTGSTPTVTANYGTAPDGTQTAERVQFALNGGTTSSDYSRITQSPATTTTTYSVSVWMKSLSGTPTMAILFSGSGNVNTMTVTSSWQRFSATRTGNGGFQLGLRGDQTGQTADVLIWGVQEEDVTGQTNQNPSEYVSTNVLTSAPYHGANVDGVKYFDTENGNTVSSNVVTEATGAAISSDTLKGYLAEGSRTNQLLYSEQFDNVQWQKAASTVTADAAASPGGSTTADKVTPNNTNASHYVLNDSSVTSGSAYTQTVYVKAAGYNYVQIASSTGFDTTASWINYNLSTGAAGNQGAGSFTSTITALPNSWYKITMTATATSTVTGRFAIAVLHADTASRLPLYTGDGTSGLYMWGAQLEQASFASSYIPTTSASVTRAADDLSYPVSGSVSDTDGTVYVEFIPNWSGGSGWDADWIGENTAGASQRLRLWHWSGQNNHTGIDRSGSGGVRNQVDASSPTLTMGSSYRMAMNYNSSAVKLFTNGTLRGQDTTLSLPYDSLSSIGVGKSSAGHYAFSAIKNVKIWKQALSDADMQAFTAGQSSGVQETTVVNNRADFQADLTSTIDLQRGQGSATFTRADGADRRATVTDFENRVIPVKQNEARFQGARRVENLLSYSENQGNAAWTRSGVTVTADAATAPDGTATADKLDATSSNSYSSQTFTVANNKDYVFSVWIKAVSSNTGLDIKILDSSGVNILGSASITATTTWQRFSVSGNSASYGSVRPIIGGSNSFSSGESIYVWGAQLEDITGQTNQNPSEYVSANVKTAVPYHGANVDGVKYFDTQNGNTVASNVVTEATGSAISSSTLKGYLSEGSRTNNLLQSEAFDDADWLKSDTTVTANAMAAPNGQTTADLVTEGTAGTAILAQVRTVTASTSYTFSAYVKRGNHDWIRLIFADSPATNQVRIWANLNTGAIGTATATGTATYVSSSIVSVGNGWYRITVTGTIATTDGKVFVLSASADGSTTRVNNAQYYVWGAQLEQASFASSYIPTTSATVTRAADLLNYPPVGNVSTDAGTFYAEAITNNPSNASGTSLVYWWSGGGNDINALQFLNAKARGASTAGGVVQGSVNIGAITTGTLQKAAYRYATNDFALFLNGTKTGSDTTGTPTAATPTALGVGSAPNGGGDQQMYGTIKNVKIWKQALSDTELQNLTAGIVSTEKKTTLNVSQNSQSASGLVGLWSFNGPDLSGTTVYDRSGQGNNGTLTNGPTITEGRVGQALSFDGVDDYVNVGSASSLNVAAGDFSLCAWFKTTGTEEDMIGKGASTGGYLLMSYLTKLRGHVWTTTSANTIDSVAVVNDGSWHFGCQTVDSTKIYLYIDGILDNSQNLTGTKTGNSNLVGIGCRIGNGCSASQHFIGTLDEVRIYNRALSATEVQDLYNKGR
jgi:hypothetical protein